MEYVVTGLVLVGFGWFIWTRIKKSKNDSGSGSGGGGRPGPGPNTDQF